MVIVSERQSPLCVEGKQSFHRLQILNCVAYKLAGADPPKGGNRTRPEYTSQNTTARADQTNHSAQAAFVCECELQKAIYAGSSRSVKPTPRTVWSSFRSNPSSILRRSRAMCTSMTLSIGVARAVSFHTSRASISRDTTAPWFLSRYSRSSYSRAGELNRGALARDTERTRRIQYQGSTRLELQPGLSRRPSTKQRPLRVQAVPETQTVSRGSRPRPCRVREHDHPPCRRAVSSKTGRHEYRSSRDLRQESRDRSCPAT